MNLSVNIVHSHIIWFTETQMEMRNLIIHCKAILVRFLKSRGKYKSLRILSVTFTSGTFLF